MIKIRLSRVGRKLVPLYTIVATDARSQRDGNYIEKLGHYNPKLEAGKNLNNVNIEKIKEWVKKGAQVSDTVRTLLKTNKIAL
jgi:small subunit ribosomal protein S16